MVNGKVEKPELKPQSKPAAPGIEVHSEVAGAGSRGGTGLPAILDARRDTAERALHRFSDGKQGTPPLPNLQTERTAPIRAAAARIMRKAAGPATGAPKIPESGGAALPSDVRKRMEPKLGADLSSVRVYTGTDSAQSATEYGARAFTVGSDVHFSAGEFKPGTKDGDKLLAHELTHVVQGQKTGIQRKADEAHAEDGDQAGEAQNAEVSHPDDPAEKEADQVADKVADGLHDAAEQGGKGDDKASGGDEGKGKGAKHKGGKGEGKSADGAKADEPRDTSEKGGDPERGGPATEKPSEKAAAVSRKVANISAPLKLPPVLRKPSIHLARAAGSSAPAGAGPAEGARPNAEVPFQMAGEAHTLYLQSAGDDVQVQMASANKLPFTDKFSQAQQSIDLFENYLSTIQDPTVKTAITSKIAEIRRLRSVNIADFKALYNQVYPKGSGRPSATVPQAKPKVEELIARAKSQLAGLEAWAASSGATDLSKAALDTRLEAEGKKAWEETWKKTKDLITATITPIKYKGTTKIDFVGSAKSGWKGPHKGLTRFDASDFDVDLYVSHPQDYAKAIRAGANQIGGKIFPQDPKAPPELRAASAQCKSALLAALPTIGRIAESVVALKG